MNVVNDNLDFVNQIEKDDFMSSSFSYFRWKMIAIAGWKNVIKFMIENGMTKKQHRILNECIGMVVMHVVNDGDNTRNWQLQHHITISVMFFAHP